MFVSKHGIRPPKISKLNALWCLAFLLSCRKPSSVENLLEIHELIGEYRSTSRESADRCDTASERHAVFDRYLQSGNTVLRKMRRFDGCLIEYVSTNGDAVRRFRVVCQDRVIVDECRLTCELIRGSTT